MRALVLVAVAATSAAADPETADRLADEAAALAKHGDHVGAARHFRDAYRSDPRAELLCNVGVSYYKAKDLPRADFYLEQCVQVGASVPAAFLAGVRDALHAIDTELRAGPFAQVSFAVQPATTAISVGGGQPFDEPFVGAHAVWFPVGTYALVFSSAGYAQQTRSLDVRAHTPSTLTVALDPTPVAVAPPPPPPRPTRSAPSRMIPISLTLLAVAEVGLALGFYVIARGHVTDANSAMTQPLHDSEADTARSWRAASVLTAVGAAVTTGAAVYIWRRALSVEPTPGGATVALSGRF